MEHEEAERWIELNYDGLKKWREEKPHINWSNFRKGDYVKVMYVFLDELDTTIARIRFYRGVILKNLKHTLELECWENLEWLKANDDKAQQIARNAAAFAKSYLRFEDELCYALAALKAVADVEKGSNILQPFVSVPAVVATLIQRRCRCVRQGRDES